ncbi:MAG: DUF5684 domain-containing protein [Bacteroidales bacterium]|jgi:hypothetical protein
MIGSSLISLAISVLIIVALWKVYNKAGKPGWAAIIPIYNIWVLLEIIKKPWWWLLLLLIPIVNIVILIIMIHNLSLKFGKGVGFTIGMILLPFIFIPILGFGDAKCKG